MRCYRQETASLAQGETISLNLYQDVEIFGFFYELNKLKGLEVAGRQTVSLA